MFALYGPAKLAPTDYFLWVIGIPLHVCLFGPAKLAPTIGCLWVIGIMIFNVNIYIKIIQHIQICIIL